jgi:hypothetical protein
LTKRFLAVDGTPLGGAHAHAPQLFSRDFHAFMFLREPDFLSRNAASIPCRLFDAQRGARGSQAHICRAVRRNPASGAGERVHLLHRGYCC